MGKLAARKKRVKRTESIGNVAPEAEEQVDALDGRIEAIQMLIPLGLQAVTEELRRAVVELAGPRYQRKESDQPLRRWGSQRGSVYLADQKLPVEVPRVRNVASATEVPLRAYQALQRPRQMDEGLLLRMLKGIATRNYEACAETVPEAFGLSRSSGSRRYVKGTARKLAQFQERSLEGYDLVALFLDGKSFADEEIIIALGVPRRTEDPSGLRAGGHRERARLPSLPVRPGRAWIAIRSRTAGRHGRRQGALQGGDVGAQGACLRATLPVSQAPECRFVPAQERALRHPSEDGGGLRQPDVRGSQGRAGSAQTGPGAEEPIGPPQPRGRPGRDPHAASLGTDTNAQGWSSPGLVDIPILG